MLNDLPTAPSSTEVNALADTLANEMRRLWEQGDRRLTEDFVSAHPSLRNHPGAVGELIYEEISLRRDRGEEGGSTEVLRRFPQWAAQLRVLLNLRDALEVGSEPDYPAAGERLGEFELLAELGRGRRGRVYLARQTALADRPVVLKLTPRADAEHHTLARLQHTNIVPLYAAHDDSNRRLRVLCMPFFGGATLAHILGKLALVPPVNRSSDAMWEAIASATESGVAVGPHPPLPPRWATDYVWVIAQIGACLADALQFAHERQLVHMDVKPSNVLLTLEGQPMLLDFHLARPPISTVGPLPMRLGGTPAYQSPEQRAAMDAIRSGQSVPIQVDGRSDVYSLGVMLYEALAGELPKTKPAHLSALNRRVSPGLSDIIAKCMATNPTDRYSDAVKLAVDLRRHLNDLPLHGVRNRSMWERWRKWRRRQPHALVLSGSLGLLLLVIGLGAGYVGHRREAAQIALDEGNAELTRCRYPEARGAFRRGLAVAEDLPMSGEMVADLVRGLRQADQAVACGELHAVAEGMRTISIADTIQPNDLAKAERVGAEIWDKRTDLFALVKSGLPLAVRENARADLLELLLIWIHLQVQLAPPEQLDARRRGALEALTEVDRELGPWAGVYLERATLAQSVGQIAEASADRRRAAATPATSAWHHLAIGNHYFRCGSYHLARTEFERATVRHPRSFWARLQLGRSDLALGHPEEALLSFAVCVGQDPDNPAGYLHQAIANIRLGRREKALGDVDRALALDPTYSQARALRYSLQRMP
ncbi:MAG: protein kinase [Planctomycetes bacterium]|nr:protein kinase [Planctomycetota bacterium]